MFSGLGFWCDYKLGWELISSLSIDFSCHYSCVTTYEPWVGEKSHSHLSAAVFFSISSKDKIGCSSSVRDSDSIIYFSTVQLQYHSTVHETSLGER